MLKEGIISDTITQDIREKGHQTIRLLADGFSFLVSDASFRPVHLSVYSQEDINPAGDLCLEAGRILGESGLDGFSGETTIILDQDAAAIVPSAFYDEASQGTLLGASRNFGDNDRIDSRYIRSRDLYLLQAIPPEVLTLNEKLGGEAHILHPLECMLSLSDQVQASDHQRGFMMAEVQDHVMSLLVVREDKVKLLNRFPLDDTSEFIYHVLNSMKQLALDRENMPLYLSGIIHEDHELLGLVKKYIRNVKFTPYYLENLHKKDINRFMLLSEASKCV